MNDLSISLLGSFQASLNEKPVSQFRTKSVQALLIYLVCQAEQRHRREALMDLLWPGLPLNSAQANMRQTLYRLRKIIPELKGKDGDTAVPFLLTNRQTIQINPDADYFADVQTFATFLASDPAQAIPLYRGDFLSDFYLPDSETFEAWVTGRRAEFRRQVLLALENETAVQLQQANFEMAAKLAQRQLTIDNLRESSHRQLLEAWARDGRRQEALTHFNSLRQLLQDELALEPEPQTIALVEAIRAGELTGDTVTSRPQSIQFHTAVQPRHNLPQRLTSFVGRQKEMAAVTNLISQNRLVMLTGVGGIGKTNLCLQVGQPLVEIFSDGVWLVELAPIADPALILQTVAHTVGLQELPVTVSEAASLRESSSRSILALLLDYLQEKHCLLILDNCEHLINAVARFVETVLQTCPKVKILASSREALSVPGEMPFHVPPLSIPDSHQTSSLSFDQWDQYDAVTLFVERATAVLPGFKLTQNNFLPLVQICQRLDGIPLALELAAARVRVLTIEQIASRLDDRFRLLTGGSRTALPRQQTLRALIDWSWELLTSAEQLLLQRLSVFAGGMNLEAVEAICADDELDVYDLLDLVSELVNKSLVIAQRESGQETRYQLLETIRQYAQERLASTGLGATFRDRHLGYFLQLAEQAEPALVGPDQVAWMNRLETELDNVRAALSWAQETNREAGLKLTTAIWRFWEHGYVREGEAYLAQFLVDAESITPTMKAKALWVQGKFNVDLADLERAQALAKESLALYRDLEDQLGIALALNLQDHPSFTLEREERQAILQERLTLFRALGEKLWVADMLGWLGWHESESNNYEQAKKYYEESISLFRELGHLSRLADILNLAEEVALWQGDYVSAGTMLKESLAIQESLGPRRSASSLQLLGRLHFRLGDYQEARDYLEKSLSMMQQAGEKFQSYWVSARLGHVFLRLGETAKARDIFVRCQRQFNEIGVIIGVVYASEGLASLAAIQEQAEKAVSLFAWADATREILQNPRPPVAQTTADQDMAPILEMMDEEAYTAANAAGKGMTMEEAIALAIEDKNITM